MEIVRKRSRTFRKKVPLTIFDVGSFEVISDLVDTIEDDIVVKNHQKNSQGPCHCCHLLPGSRRQGLQCT